MAAGRRGATVEEEPYGAWALCEMPDAGAGGATIAHLANRVAAQSPGRDLALAFGAAAPIEGWARVLHAVAREESTTATVSALSSAAAVGLGTDEGAAARAAALPAGGAELIGAQEPLAEGRAPAPRVRLVLGPFVYITRAAFDLLGGLDEGLSTSAAAVAEFGLRAAGRGLANLVTARLLVAPHGALLLDDAGRAELARRFPAAAAALSDPPTDALERSLTLARAAVERKLEVTLDARSLGPASGGTQTYTLQLLRALDDTGAVRVRALLGTDAPPELRELRNTETLAYAQALDGAPPTELVHRPQQVFSVDDLNLLAPLGHRLVITHLDLIAYHSPAYFPELDLWRRHVRATRVAMDAADRVLFLSEHARADAEREDLIEHARTAVVPLGVHASDAASAGTRPALLAGREEPFLLCLGSDYAHKNRPYALALTAALREGGWPGTLVLAGAHVEHGSSTAAEQALLAGEQRLQGAVLDLGAVSESERVWLMTHARAVVYPTLLEGFGLIPLEAAAAGVPCLFAAQSSLAELLPAHLATLDRWDLERATAAVWPLLVDEQRRAEHVNALRAVQREYTWERCARLTVEAYEDALASRARLSARAAWEAHAREREIVRLDQAVQDKTAELERLLDSLGEDGLALVGPYGLLSREDRRALLALAAREPLRRPLFAGLRGGYRVVHRDRG
jgi:alpha-1,3-rhamnosyl/mannosyltransferase